MVRLPIWARGSHAWAPSFSQPHTEDEHLRDRATLWSIVPSGAFSFRDATEEFYSFYPIAENPNKTAHNLIAELIAFDFEFILFVGSVGFNALLEFMIPTSGIAILGRRYV